MLACFSIGLNVSRAVVDLDSDGVGDVWRMKYGAAGLNAALDSDNDGRTNGAEAVAGTNPLSPSDSLKVVTMTMSGANMNLSWPSQPGKRYQLASSITLGATAIWGNVGTLMVGVEGNLSTTFTRPAQQTFYRVSVTDTDSDSDGVSDWEEVATGLNPASNHSNGLGQPADLQFLTGALSAPNVVTIDGPTTSIAETSPTPAVFTVRRSGGLNAITVFYSVSGPAVSGTDFVALSGSVVISFAAKSATVLLQPLSNATLESAEAVILTLTANAAYTLGNPKTGAAIIEDAVQANGDGLRAQYWQHLDSTSNAPYFGAGPNFTPTLTRIDPTVNFSNSVAAWPGTSVVSNYFTSRWAGEVLPEFSQIYTFYSHTDNGGRLWVNGHTVSTPLIDNWPPASVSTSERNAVIALEGGKRYSIIYEHYNNTGDHRAILSWQSANQPKQVIPQNRLFSTVPAQILSSLDVLTFIGGPTFSYQILASGNPTSFSAANLPAGLSLDTATGLITGTPTAAGSWSVALTATNATGSGSAILTLTILQTGGGITRDLWTGINGSGVATIPLSTTPNSTSTLSALQGPVNSGDNYGARIRGYITAPTTGVYQFWLASDDASELYISDDDEPVNAWKRAEITGWINVLDWPNAAKTPLLYLKAGSRYYIEVRHKESAGGDHVAVGWLKPGQTGTVPSEVIPGYVLTQYTPPVVTGGQSTLFAANLTAQGTSVTGGYGSSSLQVSADKTQAVLRYAYSNLTTAETGKHIHSGADSGLIIFDIDDATPEADGSYVWTIGAVAGLLDKDGNGTSDAADVVKLIENGDAYLNIHSAMYPAGEIKGFYRLQAGSQTFTAPAAPPAWTDDHTDANAASRFLQHATFGATSAQITSVQTLGYDAWITAQFAKTTSLHNPIVEATRNVTNPDGPTYPTALATNAWWRQSVTGDDQLRQRVAFALSEILVTSTSGPLEDRAESVSSYYDMLLSHSFGNFRDLLEAVTLHPAMGRYLDMLRNEKPDKTTGRIPNENYAREIMQLFSIGLNRLHPDGSLVLNSKGLPISTYDQDAIIGVSHVFTGWYYNAAQVGGLYPSSFNAPTNWKLPMTEVPSRHYTGQKRLLNNVVLPGLPTLSTLANQVLDPYASHSTAQINTLEYQALPGQELDMAHDALFKHPNCAPFICRQLIQRLVTSTPSRGYIYRVVSKFENNGAGVRGDMQAVIKAILLDYEARSSTARASLGYGKQREPLLRVTQAARAFQPAYVIGGTYTQTDGIISIVSTAPHRLVNNQGIVLSFTNPGAGGSATDGTYSVINSPAITTNGFSVRAKDVLGATYAQAVGGTTLTMTTAANHGLSSGDVIYVKFTSGSPQPANGTFPITFVANNQLSITVPDAVARSGNAVIAFLKGGYRMVAPVLPATTSEVTVTCATLHGLTTGASVHFNFIPGNATTRQPADGTYPITVIDPFSFTITATYPLPGTNTIVGTIVAGTAAHPFTHSGDVNGGLSSWSIGTTDTDLAQTPLRSPTVFNYFEPDYQFPGELASAGLTTPEFQLTSETNVIRQANFIYGGFFNPNNPSGLVSFKDGNGRFSMDISSWMGLRPSATGYWTDTTVATPTNDNLSNLIRQLGTLLMAGQMTTEMENEIYTQVSNTTNIPYSSATESNRRDRVRAVIHLILTSPQYTIQK